MSQATFFNSGTILPDIETITGNAGGAVGPAAGGNLDLLGGSNITITGTPVTHKLTVDLNNTVHITGSMTADTGFTATTGGVHVVDGDVTLDSGRVLLPNTAVGLTDGTIDFGGSTYIHNWGTTNFFLGPDSGNTTMTGTNNLAIGGSSMQNVTSGSHNLNVGGSCFVNLTSGNYNIAIGSFVLHNLTSGNYNTVLGREAGSFLVNGISNLILGYQSGISYTTNESSNLIIGNAGVIGDDNTLRIGTTGAGERQVNRAFLAGTYGVTPATAAATAIPLIDSAGQIGSLGLATDGQLVIGSTGATPVLAALTAGANITVTNAAGAITIAAVGLTDYVYTNVNTTPYVVLATDEYMSVDTSGVAIQINLPDAVTSGHVYIIKDRSGNAAASNITVTTVTGAVLIDGAATFTLNTAYQAIQVIGNGSAYEIF